MEDNFDKKKCYYCKVRCSFIVGNMSPWKRLTEHVQTLTSFADLSSPANLQAEEVFVTRVLEERNFWSAAQYMMGI